MFAKVNTEEQQELAGAFQIRSIPTLMVFREQIILYSEAGTLPPAVLEEVVQQARAVDMQMVYQEIAERKDGPADA